MLQYHQPYCSIIPLTFALLPSCPAARPYLHPADHYNSPTSLPPPVWLPHCPPSLASPLRCPAVSLLFHIPLPAIPLPRCPLSRFPAVRCLASPLSHFPRCPLSRCLAVRYPSALLSAVPLSRFLDSPLRFPAALPRCAAVRCALNRRLRAARTSRPSASASRPSGSAGAATTSCASRRWSDAPR